MHPCSATPFVVKLPPPRPVIYLRPLHRFVLTSLNYVLEVCICARVDSEPRNTLKPLPLRFGFHNGSSIDGLLDKDDVSLEAILDEDDLLQECKAQNTRLIDYFQRLDVLQRLLGYVTGQIEGEDRGRFKCVLSLCLCSLPAHI